MDDRQVEQIIERAVDAAIQARDEEHQRILKTLDKLSDTVYGNGKEGLTSIVARLDRTQKTVMDIANKLVTALVIAGVFGLIVLLVQAGLLRP